MTDRSQRFISPDSVKRAAQYFRDTDFEHGDHLTYFLIFKYIGAENRAVQLNDEIKRKAREAVFYLMSLYGSSENAPEREQITYPFSLPEQRLTVPLKRFANSDSFNNVRNNPGRYEGILEYDSETEEYNIAFNYLDELVEHCNLIQNKIDLNMLSAWVLRDQPFEINVNMSSQRFTSGVRLLFKDLFNITEEEETKCFTQTVH